jgi:broad specificity phosphatase PhoE
MTTRARERLLPLALAILILGAPATAAFAQQSVFLVRHAERADAKQGTAPAMASDPDLSETGRARADALAAMLKDAKIAAIVSTEYKRTQQTAAPLAKALGLTVTTIKGSNSASVVKTVRSTAGNVLIVGHSNTIPDIVKALGAPPPDAIGDDEYDNLYVLTAGTPPTVVRLHFKP